MSVCKVGVSRFGCTLWIFFKVELKEPPKGTESEVQEVVSLSVYLCVCVFVCLSVHVYVSEIGRRLNLTILYVCLLCIDVMSVRYWKKAEFNDFVHMSVCKVGVSRFGCTLWIFFQVYSEKRPKEKDADDADYDVVDETDLPRIKVSVFMCMHVCVCVCVCLVFVSRCDRATC